jgi:hypothetical protein
MSSNPIENVEEVFKALPPKLTNLEAFPNPIQLMAINHPRTPYHSSLHLPRVIQLLELGYLDFSESKLTEWIGGLPTRLTTLKLCISHLQIGSFTEFGKLQMLTTLEVNVMNSPDGGWSAYLDFSSLRRNLTTLVVNDMSEDFDECDIHNDTFKGAPRYLNDLKIPNTPFLTKERLVYLPDLGYLSLLPEDIPPSWF